MRHGVKNKKLGVNAQHKRAILRALTTSILEKGMEAEQSNRYVRTTLHKAKLVRSCVDRMITYAKKGDLSARREASRFVMSPKAVQDATPASSSSARTALVTLPKWLSSVSSKTKSS